MPAPSLYFDLGSPYAYVAVERAAVVLGRPPELEPVLLGAIFARRGSGSWALTPERDARVAELEERAARYGLPPFVWPAGWPANGLAAMRAAVWAKRQGRVDSFAGAVFRRQFAEGGDIADPRVLGECAARAGLDPDAMTAALETRAVKDELRARTERAWKAGVRGIPSLRAGGAIYYGDDRLEEAARALLQHSGNGGAAHAPR
jgi:2-hydroxychromene-2-carboxylate isomerase